MDDFRQGALAVIVDEDSATECNPPVLDEVTDAMLDEVFALLFRGQERALLETMA